MTGGVIVAVVAAILVIIGVVVVRARRRRTPSLSPAPVTASGPRAVDAEPARREPIATAAAAAPAMAPDVARVPFFTLRHGHALSLIENHLERVGRLWPGLTRNRSFERLSDRDVMDFVLDAAAVDPPGASERIPATIHRFAEVDVVVSAVDRADVASIRRLLPSGYYGYVDAVAARFGLRLGTKDLAHWILADDGDPRGNHSVHLAYLPAGSGGSTALLPTDLMSDDEARDVTERD